MSKTKNLSNLKSKKQKADHLHIDLSTKNYSIIGLGIAIIIVGYILMSPNSVDGFLPTVIAPIFLVIGYCIVIPIGILYKDTKVNEDQPETFATYKAPPAPATSNVKVS